MLYRRFGRTELRMPVFSCGGMRYQYKWKDQPLSQIPPDNQANLEATIRRAFELGINHIETARGYGSSERQLGLVLLTLPREKIIVQTKIAPAEDPDRFLAHFDESLERLQLDYVDLLALHGVNTPQLLDWSIRKGGCLAAARDLQRRGKVRHVGFSTHASLDLIMQAIQHEGDGGFDYVNLHWYFIFQRNWPAVVEAQRRDMGLFIISPSDKGGKLYDPPATLVELCQPLHPIVFNDLFCLQHPQVHTLSIGAARPTDFDLHLEALPLLEKARELLPPIVDRLRQAMRQAIGVDDPEAMSRGLPEWDRCPGQLNMQVMLWLRNLALGWG
ncbi:MAG TPA: aldo/keto reductase, partial [Phycisphaeraceae bacterium]